MTRSGQTGKMPPGSWRWRFAAVGVLFLGAVSCSGPSVRLLDRPVAPSEIERALGGLDLSDESRLTLRAEGLERSFRRDPDPVLAELASRFRSDPSEARRRALAELCLDRAEGLVRHHPEQALGRYLDVARLMEKNALASGDSSTATHARVLYNKGVEQISRVMHARGGGEVAAPGVLGTYSLKVASGPKHVALSELDLLVPAAWLEVDGLNLVQIHEDGFGAPMIGHQKRTEERLETEPTMPEAGYSLPLNAMVRFSGSKASLCLQELMLGGDAEIEGKQVRLAGDYSAPLAFYYFARKREPNKILATLRPGKYQDRVGLYSVEPYRKDKIPLVIVHGLLSSAESWVGFVNLLRADPMVRERYQVLLFNYPSGNPISESATSLREALGSYRSFHDPQRSNPMMRDMVIIGHSMGGVLSSMQIRSTGKRLERKFFEEPIETLDISPDERNELLQRLRFDANRDISRAILIAAPHRGSDFASNPIGNFGAWLIRLPFDLVDTVLGDVAVVGAMTDVAHGMVGRPMNSVTSLRPDNPLLPAVLELPVRDGVQIHSIIARKDADIPLEDSSDGVVPYKSAHLDDVRSELVVDDATHRSVVENPLCVQEVWRLLHKHVGARR